MSVHWDGTRPTPPAQPDEPRPIPPNPGVIENEGKSRVDDVFIYGLLILLMALVVVAGIVVFTKQGESLPADDGVPVTCLCHTGHR